MLERGGGLRDEDEAEAGVSGTREWKDLGEVGKGEERWFTSLEEVEMMEEEVDEERTSVGMGGGG